ncbi:YY1-associated factor 2 isoform X2 [Glossina fuscipes]|uniref:YY1-associated factor 2 isoform X2 n=1 Tax=Glossina fuscipes TaxID=7396 RepID=A0A9C5Z3P6_9MUSC|nr:YY1-associated factor 2 isoform X2 [Glossina fuscipes]
MDHKKSPVRRKRQSKVIEENFWDCSVCTYRNTAEAFKCRMCDVRKGTSTRKPRLNSALVAQQAATLPGASGTMPNGNNKSASGSRHSSSGHDKHKHKKYPARLKNVDRSTAQTREVTVNSVTHIEVNHC